MKNMILENIKPIYYFVDIVPLTYKDIYKINVLLKNNPTTNNIYDSMYYGITNFTNNKHDNWNIELVDEYNSNINTIVIKLKEDQKDNPKNKKYLVIYQNITKAINSYGCFWIEEDDNVRVMHVSIDYVIESLLQSIIKDINIWPKLELYNALMCKPRKFNAVEIDNIYKRYIETYRCKSYDEWNESTKKFNARYKI